MGTMKEAIVSKGPQVKIVDSQIPEPQANQIVIKVVVSGSNPKDWYFILLFSYVIHLRLSRHYDQDRNLTRGITQENSRVVK